SFPCFDPPAQPPLLAHPLLLSLLADLRHHHDLFVVTPSSVKAVQLSSPAPSVIETSGPTPASRGNRQPR
ncbi:hypothetical protein BaRGS_00026716, partial [Batillaria attramentaria]